MRLSHHQRSKRVGIRALRRERQRVKLARRMPGIVAMLRRIRRIGRLDPLHLFALATSWRVPRAAAVRLSRFREAPPERHTAAWHLLMSRILAGGPA